MAGEYGTLRGFVRDIGDYPNDGVTFRDITPLLGDGAAFATSINGLVAEFHDVPVDRVVGVESRGFILAAAVAYRLGAGFVPVRKAGKLPWAVVREEYELEYGSDKLEIHRDAIHPGEQILIVDDVLATGGTAAATSVLVETLGGDDRRARASCSNSTTSEGAASSGAHREDAAALLSMGPH